MEILAGGFERLFGGLHLYVFETESESGQRVVGVVIDEIRAACRRSSELALGFGLMVINRVSGLVLPYSTKYLIDSVIIKHNSQLLKPLPQFRGLTAGQIGSLTPTQTLSLSSADLAALRHALKPDVLLVVDSIQATGALKSDLSSIDVDLLCTGAQKWLLGPTGIGFACVSARMLDRMRPVTIGADSVVDEREYFQYNLTFKPDARRYEEAAPNYPGILGLGAAVNLLLRAGPAQVELEVIGWFRDWVGLPASTAGVLVTGGSAANLTALACARLPHASRWLAAQAGLALAVNHLLFTVW